MALKPPNLEPPQLDPPSLPSADTPAKTEWKRRPEPVRPQQPPLIFRLFGGLLGSLSGGMLILGMIAGVGLWRSGEEFVNSVRSLFSPPEPVEAVDVQTVVVQQIRGASELTTAVFTMEAVVPASSSRMLGQFEVGKTTLVYIAKGEVRAGVDLSAIEPANVRASGDDVLRVMLPPAQILDRKIDVGDSQVFDYNRGFLGLGPDRAPELQDQAQEMALQKLHEGACDEGILAEASDRAELVVAQLLQTSGFEQVIVESQPAANTICAPAEATTIQ